MKELALPTRILADMALLRRLPDGHAKKQLVKDDLARRQAGYSGERNLRYYLGLLPKNKYRIFFDIYLPIHQHNFQIDTLLIASKFTLVVEVKNFKGTLFFESSFNQCIRLINNRKEGYPNPILQSDRHRELLSEWLNERHLSFPPLESLVVIAFPSTILEIAPENRQITDKVLYAEQIVSKVNELERKYRNRKSLDSDQLSLLETTLLTGHVEPDDNILTKFSISPSELITGIQCPFCHTFSVEKVFRSWYCHHCDQKLTNPHEQSIIDYFLLFGPTMTNSQCRKFLNLSDYNLVRRLLKNMKIPSFGTGRGKIETYVNPSSKSFDRFLKQ